MPVNRQKVQLRPANVGQSSRQASSQMQKLRPQQESAQIQANSTSTTHLTHQQSLTVTRALIETTVATIMYLRDLMPAGSFENVSLRDAYSSSSTSGANATEPDTEVSDTQEPPGSSQSQQLMVKRLKPDASEEGNVLINYIEGMMHAIQRRYLSGMKLIVFLDPQNPDNIIEAYTLNFHYPDAKSPPTLSVEQAVQRLSVSNATRKSRRVELGVAQTEAQVVRSIKYMLRAAIEATQTLPTLPCTRYVNIKLYYTEATPASYEPPHFRVDSQDLVMGTHAVSEARLEFMAGSMQTGHHGVTMRLSSIVEHLQVNDELLPHNLERHMDDHEAQLEDAASRTILWDAEDPSPDTARTTSLPNADQAPSTSTRLLGRRLQNGNILSLVGALGFDSFQAAAVGEESIQGRFSDRVERPQDIYQDASQNGVHLDATLINQGGDSQANNSLRSAPGSSSQRVASPPIQQGNPVDREQDEIPGLQRDAQEGQPSTDSVENMLAAGQSSVSKAKAPSTSDLPESSSPATGAVSSPLAARSQRQKRKPQVPKSPPPAKIPTSKTPTARKRRSATPKTSSKVKTQAPSQAAKKQPKKKSLSSASKMITGASKKVKAKVKSSVAVVAPEVTCSCGSADQNDEMICCDRCDAWLHSVCSGYPTAQSAPEEFFCVTCRKEQLSLRPLNKTEKAAVDDQLSPLSLFRSLTHNGRILLVVRKARRVPDSNVLLDRLGCARRDIEWLLNRLVRENFVTKDSTQGAAGSKKSMVFNDCPDVKKQFLLYFTPGGQIEHDLFNLPITAEAVPMSQLPSSQLPTFSSQNSRPAAAREQSTFIDDPIESFSNRQSLDSTRAESKSSRKRKQTSVIAEEDGSEQDAEGEVDDLDTIDMLKGPSVGQRGNGLPPSKRMRWSRGVHDLDVTRKTNWDVV